MEITLESRNRSLTTALDFKDAYIKQYGKRPVAIEALHGAFMDYCFKYAGKITVPEFALAFEAVKTLIPTKAPLRVVK